MLTQHCTLRIHPQHATITLYIQKGDKNAGISARVGYCILDLDIYLVLHGI